MRVFQTKSRRLQQLQNGGKKAHKGTKYTNRHTRTGKTKAVLQFD